MDQIEHHAEAILRDGFTIIADALTPAEVARTRRAIDEILAAEEEIARGLNVQNRNRRLVVMAQGKHPDLYEFCLNPRTLPVIRRVIGEDATFGELNAIVLMPGGSGEDKFRGSRIHTDRDHYTVLPFAGGKHYPMAVNSMFCLVDFTVENGATMVWPGSHLSCQVPDPENPPAGAVHAVAPAGSVILWDAALWHSPGVNGGDAPRYGLTAYYRRGWIGGLTDIGPALPAEARAAMSDEARRVQGISPRVPEYSYVRALGPDRLAALSPVEKRVLGFPLD